MTPNLLNITPELTASVATKTAAAKVLLVSYPSSKFIFLKHSFDTFYCFILFNIIYFDQRVCLNTNGVRM